jgi:hypothetical protein
MSKASAFRRPPRSHRRRRGFAIIMVLILLAVLMGGVAVLFGVLTSTGRTAGSMIDRRKSFYQCDGTARVITKIAQDFTLESETPGAVDAGVSEMQRYVCDKTGSSLACTTPYLPGIVDPGYEIERFELEPLTADMQPTVLQSGAFANMRAAEMPILLKLAMKRTATGNRCEIEQEVSIGSIAMFQFFLFAEGFTDWNPGPTSVITGRVHANDDLCLGGQPGPLQLERVTSAGRIMSNRDAGRCRRVVGGGDAEIWDGTGVFPANTVALTTANDHVGAGASWATDAIATWSGQLQDAAHGVNPLSLPITAGIPVQSGYWADGSTLSDNAGSSRYLVDPVRTPDNNSVRGKKLACQADLRIINGVWYLADEFRTVSDPCGGWPGTPIWSDHPGSWTIRDNPANEEVEALMLGGAEPAVGQDDLSVARGWPVTSPADIPNRFSYYVFQRTSEANPGRMIEPLATERPVVSYGAIGQYSGVALPSHFVHDANSDEVCGTQTAFTSERDFRPFADATPNGCGLTEAQRLQSLLNGARTGFTDPSIAVHASDTDSDSDSDRQERARQLTINFDVQAFHDALADQTGRELGYYFRGQGREFNGIVWIGVTWEDSLDGFGSTTEFAGGTHIWPLLGTNATNDGNQPARSTSADWGGGNNPGLPYPLCSGTLAGNAMTTIGAPGQPFVIPSCTTYNEGGVRPTAIRIINAREVGSAETSDNDVLAKGLSVVSNVHGYIIGDVNTHYGGAPRTNANWVPFMAAADNLAFFSNGWSDGNAPWGDPDLSAHDGRTGNPARTAADTTYNMCLLAGQSQLAPTARSGGIQNFPVLSEDWSGLTMFFNGSMVKAFSPVYPRFATRGVKSPPTRTWSFDPKLEALENQPPGAPRYDIQAVRTWRR